MTDRTTTWLSFLAVADTPKPAMSPLELDGYLTGIIVTPQEAIIPPSAWLPDVWANEPSFEPEPQVRAVVGALLRHYNALAEEIDRSLARFDAEHIVDYRPLFLPVVEKP